MDNCMIPIEVYHNIAQYFRQHLPHYRIYKVLRRSDHPDDDYLYMVIAKNEHFPHFEYEYELGYGPWSCWTCWNEQTQSLNYGHYNLKSYDYAYEICMEYRR